MSLTRASLSGLMTAAGLIGACTNLLGLEGMTYDRRVGAVESPGTGGAGPSHLDEPHPFGSAGGESEGDFPNTWSTDALIAASHHTTDGAYTSLYFSHSPSLQTLDQFEAFLSEPDFIESATTESSWDIVVAIPVDDGTAVFGYETATGLVDYGVPTGEDGSLEFSRHAGSPGWSHLVVHPEFSPARLTAYNQTDGNFRFGPAEPGTEGEVTLGHLGPGSTHLLALRFSGGVSGLLLANRDTAEVKFAQQAGDGFEAPTLFSPPTVSEPDFSWTEVSAVSSQDSELIFYDAATGHAALGAVDLTAMTITLSEPVLWRTGITSILTIWSAGEPFALTHSEQTGVADIYGLWPLQPADLSVVK